MKNFGNFLKLYVFMRWISAESCNYQFINKIVRIFACVATS